MAGGGGVVPADEGFVEVADRCYLARYSSYDVNAGLVVGERGAVVIDTRASEPEAAQLLLDVHRLTRQPVIAVVNTHWHFDHTFGNAVLQDDYADALFCAHEAAAQTLSDEAPGVQRLAAGDDDPRAADIAAARIHVPERTFSSVMAIDLGDRVLELMHPGRGHTSGDAVVSVPDAGVVFVGDLVEESAARDSTPGYGEDCWPLEWAPTLDLVIGLLTDRTVVVPGHGSPVDRAFVERQRQDIADVAEIVRALAERGVAVDDALAEGSTEVRQTRLAAAVGSPGPQAVEERGWPFDEHFLVEAVRRGYQHLGVRAGGL